MASPYYGMKILVAAASDRANTVHFIPFGEQSLIVEEELPPPS